MHRKRNLLSKNPEIGLLLLFFFAGSVTTRAMEPTCRDVSYGSHERNTLDFWQADGEEPRPLVVFIHGGGWTSGDKTRGRMPYDWKKFLEKGISYAAINYRYSTQAPLPAPVHDAARAIQYLRSRADEWNIDKERIALTGTSAGACSSMWILFHDDLADPQADDLVLRESTRVTAAAVTKGQTSIDPKVIEPWAGPNILAHRMICLAVGEGSMADVMENYEKHGSVFAEFSPYTHVDKNDPPLYMSYGSDMTLPSKDSNHGIHHGVLGVKLKEKSDETGHECHLDLKGFPASEEYSSSSEFLMDKLLAPKVQRVLCLGDSITRDNQWVSRVGEHPAFETVNAGQGGRKTSAGKKILAARLETEEHLDRLILFLGVNDLPARVKLPNDEKVASCVKNMGETIDLALTAFNPGDILLLAPCGINAKTMSETYRKKGFHIAQPMLEQLEKEYADLAQEKGVQFLSLLNVVGKENYRDGLHPNAAGQIEIADAILNFLAP